MSNYQLLIGRAAIKRVLGNATALQVTAYAGEVRQVQHADTYGLATSPLPDMQAIVTYPNGNRAHGIATNIIDKQNRPSLAEAGAVTLYTYDGTQVQLLPTGEVHITTSSAITLTAPTVTIDGQLQVTGQTQLQQGVQVTGNATVTGQVSAAGFGGASGAPATMDGGANISGTVAIDGTATIGGERVSTNSHAHTDAEGRSTSGAQ